MNFAAHADNYSTCTITSSRRCRFSWGASWRSRSTSIKERKSPLGSSHPADNKRCNPQCNRRSAVFTNAVIFVRSKQRALNHCDLLAYYTPLKSRAALLSVCSSRHFAITTETQTDLSSSIECFKWKKQSNEQLVIPHTKFPPTNCRRFSTMLILLRAAACDDQLFAWNPLITVLINTILSISF